MATNVLVCDCPIDGHLDGCTLLAAEVVAINAVRISASMNGHRLLAAFAALVDVGALLDLDDDDPEACLIAILDALYELGALQ